jgi:hypothetical protein
MAQDLRSRVSASNEALATIYGKFQDFRIEKKGSVDFHSIQEFLARRDVKEVLQKLLEIEELPLDGFDLIPIPSKDGDRVVAIKGYINQTGAAIKAQQWVDSKNSSIIGYTIEILESPSTTNNGRAIIKTTLTVRDDKLYEEVLQKAEKLSEGVVKALLEGVITKVNEIGAHSYAMELSPRNRTPEAVIKKAATQGFRRAHLKLAKPLIRVDEDDEIDVRLEKSDVKPLEIPKPEPLALSSATEKVPQKPEIDAKVIYAEIKGNFKKAGKGPADALKWMKSQGIDELARATPEQLQKALEDSRGIRAEEEPKPTPKEVGKDAVEALFALAKEKMGLTPQAFEQWALDMWGKKPRELSGAEIDEKTKWMRDI